MISIIIPTFNRPARLAACLESMTRLRYPKEGFEVIVVDDGGNADLGVIIDKVRESINVRLITQNNTGPAGARNAGAANATGEFIAFTDDDCTPAQDWLTALAQRWRQDPAKMYGGHTVNALESNIYSAASQSLIDYLYSYYNADPERARFFASNNMAMARNMFEAAGGFDTNFPAASGEDRELCDRWLQLGHGMTLVPEARVYHHHGLTFRTFWTQHFNYGTGAWRFRQSRRLRQRDALKIEPLTFYLNLVGHAGKKKLHRRHAISALMVLSQIANAAGFFRAKFIHG